MGVYDKLHLEMGSFAVEHHQEIKQLPSEAHQSCYGQTLKAKPECYAMRPAAHLRRISRNQHTKYLGERRICVKLQRVSGRQREDDKVHSWARIAGGGRRLPRASQPTEGPFPCPWRWVPAARLLSANRLEDQTFDLTIRPSFLQISPEASLLIGTFVGTDRPETDLGVGARWRSSIDRLPCTSSGATGGPGGAWTHCGRGFTPTIVVKADSKMLRCFTLHPSSVRCRQEETC